MRILHVLNTLGVGGAEQYVAQVSSFQARHGDDVAVISGEPFSLASRFDPSVDIVHMELHPGPNPSLGRYLRSVPTNALRIRNLLLERRVQLVHTHLAASALPAWIGARMAGVPVLHSKMCAEAATSRYERTLFHSPLPGLLVQHYLAFSGYLAKEMAHHWSARPENIVLSSIGVDTARFDPSRLSRSDARRQLGLRDDTFVVGQVARFTVDKGVRDALIGFAAMSNTDSVLLLCGDGPLRQELEALTASLGIGARVRFLGVQSDVRPTYAASNVIIQATRDPNMGMSALEAMSMAVPLAIVVRSAMEREMAVDTFGGLDIGYIVDVDPQTMGKQLDELAKGRDSLPEVGQRARAHMQATHDTDTVLRELRRSYMKIAHATDDRSLSSSRTAPTQDQADTPPATHRPSRLARP